MSRPEHIKPYNQAYFQELIEEGYTPSEAVRIAATEMDGASALANGSINARQTACNVLNYSEDLSFSVEAATAAEIASEAAEAEARNQGFPSLIAYYQSLGLNTEDLTD